MIRTRRLLESYLAFLAKMVIFRFRPRTVAVTGSVGKTTTTTFIYGLLKGLSEKQLIGEFRSNSTNNMNGTVGVFLTILGSNRYVGPDFAGLREVARLTMTTICKVLKPGTTYPEILLLECGISGKGEMRRMVRDVRPNIVVVTTVGHAHLEWGTFTLADIAREKSELVRACKHDGMALLGAENEWTRNMALLSRSPSKLVEGKGVTFGVNVAKLVADWLGVPNTETELLLDRPATAPHHRLERIEGMDF